MLRNLLFTALLLTTGLANAGTITVAASVPLQSTDFDTVVSVDKFDDLGGTRILQSVSVSLEGFISGSGSLESLDVSPSVVTSILTATMTLSELVTNNVLVISIPTLDEIFNATAFDGVIDFAGTSGITYGELTANQVEVENYTDALTLSLFTGLGTIDLSLDAAGVSFASGSGNLITQFSLNAGGNIEVTYTYDDAPVSAPAHALLFALGMISLLTRRFIKR